jgi:hypothetical protein
MSSYISVCFRLHLQPKPVPPSIFHLSPPPIKWAKEGLRELWINELNYHFSWKLKRTKGWSWDYNFCFGGESTKLMKCFFFFFTRTHTDSSQCSWHGELIKMMFSLRGALRFFAFLWLFNLLFAMLVIAITHSSPIFCNGSSDSHTHTHTSSVFAYGVFTFLWVYFESQTLSVRSLTIGNTHHHQQKRRKSAVMSASGK